ncbi:hypothetical protein TBR22_A21310 [Luteitalea sp. TBR-22]|uniref:hypothetical protein n=1 Tax=Luteitalea sp. TBR-22 TaxID=2802971 RepID=UPI001AF4D975|nr:hypothetical protein [Luteitalea sp. TBR-22]BCS32907.1 hypothetical protein TBR22_A21310 [Luteitalea sp. TBR-22]
MTTRRARRLAYGLCLFTAFLVWNGIFGLLVSRGEKQYLLDQARHELRLGPPASLPDRMRGTIRNGINEATRWAVVVFVLGAFSVWLATRPSTDEESPGRPGGLLDD